MNTIQRGMVIDVNLEPTLGAEKGKTRPCVVVTNNIFNHRVPIIQVVPLTTWNDKKSKIRTNIVIQPTADNGLLKLSIADCLQTRPIDHRYRLVNMRGIVAANDLQRIDQALKIIFGLR